MTGLQDVFSFQYCEASCGSKVTTIKVARIVCIKGSAVMFVQGLYATVGYCIIIY